MLQGEDVYAPKTYSKVKNNKLTNNRTLSSKVLNTLSFNLTIKLVTKTIKNNKLILLKVLMASQCNKMCSKVYYF